MVPGVRRFFQNARTQDRGKHSQSEIAGALDELRKFGYRVFDNVKRNRRHLDHVIVGPAGAFAIETNFRSGDGEEESVSVVADRSSPADEILVGEPPGKSARHEAINLRQVIRGNCEFDGWVWPLAVIAGEWRVENGPPTTEARLFTKKTLVSYIINQPSRLTSTEIDLIASHLERSANVIVKLKKKSPARNKRKRGV